MFIVDSPPFKLKIEIQELPHKVIREVLVPENLNMWQVHLVIQFITGWENMHLFEFKEKFVNNEISVEIPDEFFEGFHRSKKINLTPIEAKLKELFWEKNKGKPFFYVYDFGDNWRHKITFKKPSESDLKNYKGMPYCVHMEGACPPENIGGPPGYTFFLDAIKNQKHPEHIAFAEWIGIGENEKYDEFELPLLRELNKDLEDLTSSDYWNAIDSE